MAKYKDRPAHDKFADFHLLLYLTKILDPDVIFDFLINLASSRL
jgi:hypothetical protein